MVHLIYCEHFFPVCIAAASPSGGVGEFSASMTPEQLHDWLQAKHMPPADCKIIKGYVSRSVYVQHACLVWFPEAIWEAILAPPNT